MAFDPSREQPRAEKRPVTATHHGIDKVDEYDWLRAPDWQSVMRDPAALPDDIRAYLEAENDYQSAQMADTGALQDELFEEMKGRIAQDDSSVPAPDGAYAYASRYVEGAEYPLFVRTPRDGGEETVLFDGPAMAQGKDYYALGHMAHSPDHRKLAWDVDDNGSEYYHLRIRDLETGEDGERVIRDVGGVAWCADSQRLMAVEVDENHRPNKVWLHTPDGERSLVYEEADPRFYVGVSKSQDGRWILIGAGQNDEDEVRLVPADDPAAEPILVLPRSEGHEYDVEPHGDRLFIRTNRDGATNYKLMEADVAAPGEWRDLIAHRDDVMILSVAAFAHHLVRLERANALPQIVIRDLRDGSEHAIAFDEEAYALGMSPGYEFDTTTLRFTYSSPSTPSQVWDYDMATRERTLRKEQRIPSGHDAGDYVVRRLFAPSTDGVSVPLTVLHHRDTPLDGTAPCLLYGYGSYGAGMPAGFSTNRLSLVDRGFVYCTAHIRGGDEMGRGWYEQTKKDGKQRTFQDFIAAGEYLASQGYTARGRIVAQGGSAGGLLMGAVANMAPDLFGGIIAQVPFVDVLNTMLDDTLPLTPGEWNQWGNPLATRHEYETIAAYSPYDNVADRPYPPILAMAGLTDPRVTYWEPAKWVARIRERSGGKAMVMLKTNMGSGHFGRTGRFAYLEEVALTYAFALRCVGLADTEGRA